MKRSKSKKVDPRSVEARFPTVAARTKADEAIDLLDPTSPMTSFIDAWYAAYVAFGGIINGKVS